jgi:cytochrome-b5 reductase
MSQLTISFNGETSSFTAHKDLAKNVREHFKIPKARFILTDWEGHVVVLDETLPTGKYVLQAVQEHKEYGSPDRITNVRVVTRNPEIKAAKLDAKTFNHFELIKLEKYNHNTKIFTFRIPGVGHLPVSSFLQCQALVEKENKEYARAYTPLSCLVEDEVRLLVKVYPEGRVTQAFDKLKVGDTFQIRGPVLKLPWKANMKEEVAMLAGGSGITPMLQVIDLIISNPEDKTLVNLLFANQTEEDILLREHIDGLAAKHKNIKVHYSVDKPSSTWKGFGGFITKDTLQKVIPEQKRGESILIYVCGPPGFYKCVSGDKDFTTSPPGQGELTGLLKEMGYTSQQVFKF